MAGAQGHQSQWQDLGTAWNVVIEFTAAVAVYGGFGWFADRWLGTTPFLFLLGLVIGTVLGIYLMIKRANQVEDIRATRKSGRAPH